MSWGSTRRWMRGRDESALNRRWGWRWKFSKEIVSHRNREAGEVAKLMAQE